MRPSIKGTLRTQNNFDLEDLSQSGLRQEKVSAAQVIASANSNELDRQIDSDDVNHLPTQQDKGVSAGADLRYSEDFARTSLLK